MPTPVELSILCAPPDLPFLEPTVRHQLRTFAGSPDVGNRVLVIDRGRAPGPDASELDRLGAALVAEGLIDEVRPVDYDPVEQAATMTRWYGGPDASTGAVRQRAIYQYAFSIDRAVCPLVLHLDSDMLFHGDAGWWLGQAVSILEGRDDVTAIVGNGAVPAPRQPRDWLLGPTRATRRWPPGVHEGFDITSRAVLLHRERLEAALPLRRDDPGEQWEASLSHALERSGLRRATLVDDRFWMLHPLTHNETHVRHLDGLIDLVERGDVPYRRFGRPWDITTRSWRFLPWRLRLAASGRRRVA
jgi:hypothetical protein